MNDAGPLRSVGSLLAGVAVVGSASSSSLAHIIRLVRREPCPSPVGADIDQNPNAAPFGPAQCEDGRYLEKLYTPGGIVGQQIGTNGMGTSHLAWLAFSDGTKVAPLGPPLSPGLEKLTVFCWWANEDSPTGYIGGDILFGGHGRP